MCRVNRHAAPSLQACDDLIIETEMAVFVRTTERRATGQSHVRKSENRCEVETDAKRRPSAPWISAQSISPTTPVRPHASPEADRVSNEAPARHHQVHELSPNFQSAPTRSTWSLQTDPGQPRTAQSQLHRTPDLDRLCRKWCPGAESNHRHCDFQSHALPTELPGQVAPKSKHLRRRQPEGLLIRGRLSRVQPKSPAAALHF